MAAQLQTETTRSRSMNESVRDRRAAPVECAGGPVRFDDAVRRGLEGTALEAGAQPALGPQRVLPPRRRRDDDRATRARSATPLGNVRDPPPDGTPRRP